MRPALDVMLCMRLTRTGDGAPRKAAAAEPAFTLVSSQRQLCKRLLRYYYSVPSHDQRRAAAGRIFRLDRRRPAIEADP
jgi:hypothetical protein